jgi:peptidoglycan/xylan/chitin deacetylase (PgdA/CDA1 family)/lysophospholipase L1-like esterase
MSCLRTHYRFGFLLLFLFPLMLAPAAPASEIQQEPLPVAVFKNLEAGKKQTVVVYGTSLTIKGEWTKALSGYFDKQFPGLVTFHNNTKAGMRSDWGVANLQEKVLAEKPDLVFIEFSINDAATKHNISMEKSQSNLDSIVKALRRQNPEVDIVLQTMNLAWDSPRVPEKKYGSERSTLESYFEVYRRYARNNQLPLVDHYPNWLKIEMEEPERYQKMVPDGIHPSSTSSATIIWPAVEALLEKARGYASLGYAAAMDTSAPHARIAQFSGDRAAAVSYTFDDGLRDQYTLAVPMLNEVGFKGTFFIIPGSTAETPQLAEQKQNDKRAWGSISWPELKTMAAQGHEISNHTWSHRNMLKLSVAEFELELSKACDAIKARLGQPPLTLAFPFNQSTPELHAAALKHHVAFRAYQTGLSEKSTVESLNAWADKQVHDKTWGILMAHSLANGYAALKDPEILRSHLHYVKSRDRDIWVDTFANIARYEKQRDDAKLEVSGRAGNLTCKLSSRLDPELYNIPLTLSIDAPGATSAIARSAGAEVPVQIVGGKLLVEAIPDSQTIVITWK